MNHVDQSLQRLLRAARRAHKNEEQPPPVFLETRLIALWRSRAPEPVSLLPMFRLAAVCAILVMLSSLGWNWIGQGREVPGAAAFVSFEKISQVVP